MKRSPLGPGERSLGRGSTFRSAAESGTLPATKMARQRSERSGPVTEGLEPSMQQDRTVPASESPAARGQRSRKGLRRSPKRPPGAVEIEAHRAFAKGRETARCVMCGARGCDPHHVVTEARCRHAARWLGVPEWRLAYDKRNRLWVCRRHHDAHHSRARPITQAVLRKHAPKVFAFAWEIGELPWLERMYPQGGER